MNKFIRYLDSSYIVVQSSKEHHPDLAWGTLRSRSKTVYSIDTCTVVRDGGPKCQGVPFRCDSCVCVLGRGAINVKGNGLRKLKGGP